MLGCCRLSYCNHSRLALFFLSLLGVLPTLPQFVSGAAQQDLRTGREIYQAACANCHGSDGRGAPASRLGFDTELPDFSNCSFATREQNPDWIAIVHEGGPIRGFSELMPAFGEALTHEQLELAVSHIRTFCRDANWPRGELNLPRPFFTEKAYPEDEAVLSVEVSLEKAGAVQNELVYEKRFGARNQIELDVPFGWNEFGVPGTSGSDWRGGLGDIALGVKRAMWHSIEKGSIFSVAGEVVFPTGDEADGFSTGTAVLEPFVAYGQILPGGLFLHGQAGVEFPTDTDKAEREAFWRGVLGGTATAGPWGRSFTPMLEVLATKELVAGEKVNWDLVPQIQISLNQRQHVMVDFGVRLPVTDSGIRDTSLVFYLLWDWYDGGFLEGW